MHTESVILGLEPTVDVCDGDIWYDTSVILLVHQLISHQIQ